MDASGLHVQNLGTYGTKVNWGSVEEQMLKNGARLEIGIETTVIGVQVLD